MKVICTLVPAWNKLETKPKDKTIPNSLILLFSPSQFSTDAVPSLLVGRKAQIYISPNQVFCIQTVSQEVIPAGYF